MKQSIQSLLFVLLLLAPVAAFGQNRTAGAEVPEEGYTLTAAYPNPFNASTSFGLSVDRRQQVTVEVYNLLGQRVATLFEGVMNANEPRRFTFDASNVPSGIYLYSVRGESFAETRQVTLLR